MMKLKIAVTTLAALTLLCACTPRDTPQTDPSLPPSQTETQHPIPTSAPELKEPAKEETIPVREETTEASEAVPSQPGEPDQGETTPAVSPTAPKEETPPEETKAVDYDSQLNPGGNGIMGYVEIPKISVILPIYHGTEAVTLERGIGHLLGSSLPVGGDSTHTIITGHSGLATQKMFTDLEQLREGDVFYIHVLGEVLAYQVFSAEPVLPHDTSKLVIRQNEDLCTLITCYPTGVNTHRLLVQGERIPYEAAEEIVEEMAIEEVKPESRWEDQYMLGLWLGIWAMLLALAIYLSVLLIRRTRAKKKGGRYARKKETKRR